MADTHEKYPIPAVVFLTVIAVCAAATLVLLATGHPGMKIPLMTVGWALFAVLCESRSIYLQENRLFLSALEVILTASYLTIGAIPTVIVILAATLVSVSRGPHGMRHAFNHPFRYTLFNAAHFIVVLGCIEFVYHIITPVLGERKLLQAIAIAPLFFLGSSTLNALFFRYECHTPLREYWRVSLRPTILQALISGFAGIVIARAYTILGAPVVILLAVPVLLSHRAFLDLSGTEENIQ